MTHTSTELPELLPCPFCGGKAEIDTDTGWKAVECTECRVNGEVMLDADDAAARWNRRTPASQAQRVPLSDEQRRAIFDDLWPHGADSGIRKLFAATVFATEAAHGITQEKQG